MCSPCITIQERDTQHLLVGLGPPRVRTPTVGHVKSHFGSFDDSVTFDAR
jgi:hypothetical protein